ncbi:DUF3050 domain-containing protein [Gammaproteobacteria bacterium]
MSNLKIHTNDLLDCIRSHSLYEAVSDENRLRIFMRAHAFAVWDFQTLLKSLQQVLTCVDIPWLPTADPEARRFINEIVLEEESDLAPGGNHLSHFELYLEAMKQCGADSNPIHSFLADLRSGKTVDKALQNPVLPKGVVKFVKTTMDIVDSRYIHKIAAAFSFGREEVIPTMFRNLVEGLARIESERWSTFHYYLTRHIDCDEGKHGPFSRLLVNRLCGDQETLWKEAEEIARTSLKARIDLWDAILSDVESESGFAVS